MSVHAWPYYKRTGEHFMKLFVSDFHRQMLKATDIPASDWLRAIWSVKITDKVLYDRAPPPDYVHRCILMSIFSSAAETMVDSRLGNE